MRRLLRYESEGRACRGGEHCIISRRGACPEPQFRHPSGCAAPPQEIEERHALIERIRSEFRDSWARHQGVQQAAALQWRGQQQPQQLVGSAANSDG